MGTENKYLEKVCALLRPPVKKGPESPKSKKNKYSTKIDKLKKRRKFNSGETTYK